MWQAPLTVGARSSFWGQMFSKDYLQRVWDAKDSRTCSRFAFHVTTWTSASERQCELSQCQGCSRQPEGLPVPSPRPGPPSTLPHQAESARLGPRAVSSTGMGVGSEGVSSVPGQLPHSAFPLSQGNDLLEEEDGSPTQEDGKRPGLCALVIALSWLFSRGCRQGRWCDGVVLPRSVAFGESLPS